MKIYLIGMPCMRKPGSSKHERWRVFREDGVGTHPKSFHRAKKGTATAQPALEAIRRTYRRETGTSCRERGVVMEKTGQCDIEESRMLQGQSAIILGKF